jgi:hypothetical protein
MPLALVATLLLAPRPASANDDKPRGLQVSFAFGCISAYWTSNVLHDKNQMIFRTANEPDVFVEFSGGQDNYEYCDPAQHTTYTVLVQTCDNNWPWGSACSGWVTSPPIYVNRNWIGDGGFENWTTPTIAAPWETEGTGGKGLDINRGNAHSGNNNAWIRATSGWNAIKINVFTRPNTDYELTGWFRTSPNVKWAAYFGARDGNGKIINETSFGPYSTYQGLGIGFNSGNNWFVTVYVGFWAPNADSWIQIDDLWLTSSELPQ